MSVVVGVSFSDTGARRSLPADVSITGQARPNVPNPTEHPSEPSVSAQPLEPAQEADDAAIPETVFQP